MAETNLLDAFGARLGEGLKSWATGEPPAGSTAAMQKELVKLELQNQINRYKSNPNDPNARDALLKTATTLQDVLNTGQKQSNRNTLDFLSSPELAQAAGTKVDLRIREKGAETDNKLREYGALHGQRKDIMSMLQDHEMAVRGGSQAELHDKIIGYYDRARTDNVALQREANSFGNKIPGLLGGLLAAAAAFA